MDRPFLVEQELPEIGGRGKEGQKAALVSHDSFGFSHDMLLLFALRIHA